MSLMHFDTLLTRIEAGTAHIGIIGLGYVGLPLAVAIGRHGYPLTGFDIDPTKITQLQAGQSYIEAVADADLVAISTLARWTRDFSLLAEVDVLSSAYRRR